MTIQIEKEGSLRSLPITHFAEEMGCSYVPHLQFLNEKIREKVVKKTQKLYRKGGLTRRQLWLGSYYRQEMEGGYLPDLTLRWLSSDIGWGVFAARSLRAGEFIGEYGGVLRKRLRIDQKNSYCFHYAIAEDSFLPYNIDAREQGGITRWINHSFTPNLLTTLATFNGVTHIVLLTGKPIPKGAQLLYDYGPNYWASRKGLHRMDP